MPSQLCDGLMPYLRRVTASRGPDQLEDGPLLARFAAQRDEAAFAALVHRHGPMVLGVCRRVLHHGHDAEDAFQATFLVLARKANSIAMPQQLASWLHGVAYRTALEAKTRRARRQFRERQMIAAATVEPSADALWADVRRVLDEEIARLPARYRLPFVLCYLEGKTNEEAAQILACPPGTVYSRLAWARDRLRKRLTGRGVGVSAALFGTLLIDKACAASVPSALAQATVKAGRVFADGPTTTTLVSSEVLALTQGVLKTMHWTTTKILAGALLLAASLFVSGSWVLSAANAQIAPPAVKAQGDAAGKQSKFKNDEERIVGYWKVLSGRGGEDMPAEMQRLARLIFTKDGKMTFKVIETAKEGTFKITAKGEIDVQFKDEKEIGRGIYKFDGDNRLQMCFYNNSNGNERPKQFSGERDLGTFLLSLERAKPGEENPAEKATAQDKEAVDKIREAAARMQSQNNLKQIGLAFHVYHDTNGIFPAHAIYSKDGKTPLLSWRVAILPYIDQLPLYNQFKLDEPWDSEHNKKLIPKMPKQYEPSWNGKPDAGLTFYQVFTGPDTAFDGNKAMKIFDITDGTSNTILAVEGKDSVIWSKPADLTLPKQKDRITPIGGLFKNGTNAAYFDGSVRFLSRAISGEELRALVTPRGGD